MINCSSLVLHIPPFLPWPFVLASLSVPPLQEQPCLRGIHTGTTRGEGPLCHHWQSACDCTPRLLLLCCALMLLGRGFSRLPNCRPEHRPQHCGLCSAGSLAASSSPCIRQWCAHRRHCGCGKRMVFIHTHRARSASPAPHHRRHFRERDAAVHTILIKPK